GDTSTLWSVPSEVANESGRSPAPQTPELPVACATGRYRVASASGASRRIADMGTPERTEGRERIDASEAHPDLGIDLPPHDVVLTGVVTRVGTACAEFGAAVQQVVGAEGEPGAGQVASALEDPVQRQVHVDVEGPEIAQHGIGAGLGSRGVGTRIPVLAHVTPHQHGAEEILVVPANARNDLPARRPPGPVVD